MEEEVWSIEGIAMPSSVDDRARARGEVEGFETEAMHRAPSIVHHGSGEIGEARRSHHLVTRSQGLYTGQSQMITSDIRRQTKS